ncbi:MAG: hypothetical protein ACRERU_14440 [Methylococcales bacterium]
MKALLKIQKAGFQITLIDEDKMLVSPASKLTDTRREFIRRHKPELIEWLRDEQCIRDWLMHIEEADESIIRETIDRCRVDRETRAYFLMRWRLSVN